MMLCVMVSWIGNGEGGWSCRNVVDSVRGVASCFYYIIVLSVEYLSLVQALSSLSATDFQALGITRAILY